AVSNPPAPSSELASHSQPSASLPSPTTPPAAQLARADSAPPQPVSQTTPLISEAPSLTANQPGSKHSYTPPPEIVLAPSPPTAAPTSALVPGPSRTEVVPSVYVCSQTMPQTLPIRIPGIPPQNQLMFLRTDFAESVLNRPAIDQKPLETTLYIARN